MHIRDAKREDARQLAWLLNLAGEGIPAYLWGLMAGKGETVMDVGARRVAGDEAAFSYINARVCADAGGMLGAMVAYRLADPYSLDNLDDYPEIVRPLVRLEAKVPGSWYINAVATFEEHRGRGVASLLFDDTEALARAAGCDRMSLIVASENLPAKRLYESRGFEGVTALPVIPYPGCLHAGDWLLMTRGL